jgi:hypothetical protein
VLTESLAKAGAAPVGRDRFCAKIRDSILMLRTLIPHLLGRLCGFFFTGTVPARDGVYSGLLAGAARRRAWTKAFSPLADGARESLVYGHRHCARDRDRDTIYIYIYIHIYKQL